MTGSVVAALVLFSQASPNPGKYEIGERLKELDHAWTSITDKSRRLAALPKISAARQAMASAAGADACRLLDEATAALMGRSVKPGDAITLRFDPPYAEPRTPAKLRIAWAYATESSRSVSIQAGRQTVVATPGRSLTIEVRPELVNPEIIQNPEVGFLMPIQVDAEQRSVFLSIIKKPRERLLDLRDTKQPEAITLVRRLERAFANPVGPEADLPLIQYLFTAELLNEGRLRPERADNLPLVSHRGTQFRATFPRQVRGPITVVVGLPDSGADENTFFETHGQGRAVLEAARRRWAFVSARPSDSSISDVMDWIRTRRKQPVARIFLIGHGNGAEAALKAIGFTPNPSAAAAFGPTVSALSKKAYPMYVSVGKQDELAVVLRGLAKEFITSKVNVFEEFDACDQSMVAGDSMVSAFRFFDSVAAR